MPSDFKNQPLTNNFMFYKTCSVYPDLCKHILELILGKPINRIETPDYEKTIDITYVAKSIRLDVYMNDDDGTVYDLEMQTINETNLPKRARYYRGMIDLDLLEKGKDYDLLPYSLIIFICTFDYYKMGYPIYSFKNLCECDSSLPMGDQTQKVFVNLTGNRSGLSENVCAFFDYLQFGTVSDDFTQALDEALKEIKSHHEWEVEYMNWNAYEMDHRIGLRHAEEKGHEEGLAEGLKKGLEEGLNQGLNEGLKKGRNSTLNIIARLVNGESSDEIIASGVNSDDVNAAVAALNMQQS